MRRSIAIITLAISKALAGDEYPELEKRCHGKTEFDDECLSAVEGWPPLVPSNVTEFIFDIGLNGNARCGEHLNNHQACIGFEPQPNQCHHAMGAAHGNPKFRMQFTVCAAVSAGDAIMKLARGGVSANFGSSTLLPPAGRTDGSRGIETRKWDRIAVPVLSLSRIMDWAEDGGRRSILYIKTDMQGFDFKAMASIGSRAARIPFLKTEVWAFNLLSYSTSSVVHNDLCRDWIPHMQSLNFSVAHVSFTSGRRLFNSIKPAVSDLRSLCAWDHKRGEAPRVGLGEADVYWFHPKALEAAVQTGSVNSGALYPPSGERWWSSEAWKKGTFFQVPGSGKNANRLVTG